MSRIYLNVKRELILIDHMATRYEIWSCGWVYNCETHSVMRGGRDADGYHIVSLSVGGVKYTRKIHRLVAQAFIPNPDNLPEVDHLDGDKWNNEMSNLEWVTGVENTHRAINMKLRYGIMDEVMAKAICILLQDGTIRASDISRVTGVPKSSIIKIKNRVNWCDVSKNYDFSNYKFTRGLSGSKNPNAKLDDSQRRAILDMIHEGMSPTVISKKLNIKRHLVYGIRTRLYSS